MALLKDTFMDFDQEELLGRFVFRSLHALVSPEWCPLECYISRYSFYSRTRWLLLGLNYKLQIFSVVSFSLSLSL